MNLKESFRYQKFLDHMMRCACASIMEREHSVWVTKNHRRSEVNPEAEDFSEDVVCAEEFFLNDWVVQFMDHLVEEKEKLSNAIGKAKAAAGLDIDAAIEVNRYRQLAASSIEQMLAFTPKQRTEQGTGYKFNVEGNQTKYVYEIDIPLWERRGGDHVLVLRKKWNSRSCGGNYTVEQRAVRPI